MPSLLASLRRLGPVLLVMVVIVACVAPAPATPVRAVAPGMAAPTSGNAPTPPLGSTSTTRELTVFAAASLSDVFKEIGAEMQQTHPRTKVGFQFAGSPALRTQLQQGAKADVFASADEQNMQGAQHDGTIAGAPRVFAQNRLVIITPVQTKIGITRPQDLTQPGLKLVIGQKDLPAGNYARQSFDRMSTDPAYGADFATQVLARVVSEEANVKQVVAKVQLGEADAGIVYSTDASPAVRAHVKIVEIPATFNVTARYPIALVKGCQNSEDATAFVEYVLSPAGQAILEKHGFIRMDTNP